MTEFERLHAVENTTRPDRTADIVFVHGIGGSAKGTWEYQGPEPWHHFYWPSALAVTLPQCGVWALEYGAGFTRWGRPGLPLQKRAGNIADRLINTGLHKRPIFFIAHSMGGLLVKHLIVDGYDHGDPDRKALVSMIRGVVFCGTPHRGAAVATAASRLAKLMGPQAHLREMMANEDALDFLHDKFLAWQTRTRVPVDSYAESVGISYSRWFLRWLPRMLIVPRTSANTGIPGAALHDEPADHFSLVKPTGYSSDIYEGTTRFLTETLNEIARVEYGASAILTSSSVTPHVNLCVGLSVMGLGPAYKQTKTTLDYLPEFLRVKIVSNEIHTPPTTLLANVANADALVVILGPTPQNFNNFGSGSRRSILEKEIAQAEMLGKPVLALLYEPTSQVTSDSNPRLIKLRQHLVERWDARSCISTEELTSQLVAGVRRIADAMSRGVVEEGIDSIISEHLRVVSLMRDGQYEEALSVNMAILKDRPFSPRAHYNAACINCWLARSATGEQRKWNLLQARTRLCYSLRLGIRAFLSLAGITDAKEQTDRILGDPDLEPLFEEWPQYRVAIAEGRYRDMVLQHGCIAYDAMIELADGRFIPVQQLRVGDRVQSDTAGTGRAGTVSAVDAILASAVVYADGQPFCTEGQPIVINGAWAAAETLLELDSRYSLSEGEAVAFALHISPTHTFVVNGHLAHNK